MPVSFTQAQPLAAAVARLSDKTPIGALLKSVDWLKVPIALRERAFFSATVTSAEFLETAARGLREIAAIARRSLADGSEGAYQNKQKLVADLMQLGRQLGLAPQDPIKAGTLEDVTSLRRLELIVNFNTEQAQEYARWKTEQDPAILDAYPAQELVRIEEREVPRDWPARWKAAGGELRAGRMVALKNDGIWTKLSRFGTPFPPFDFNSGMGLEDVSREDAEQLGLIRSDQQQRPMDADFNRNLAASVENLSPRMQGALETIFGDQVEIRDGRAQWKGGAQV